MNYFFNFAKKSVMDSLRYCSKNSLSNTSIKSYTDLGKLKVILFYVVRKIYFLEVFISNFPQSAPKYIEQTFFLKICSDFLPEIAFELLISWKFPLSMIIYACIYSVFMLNFGHLKIAELCKPCFKLRIKHHSSHFPCFAFFTKLCIFGQVFRSLMFFITYISGFNKRTSHSYQF